MARFAPLCLCLPFLMLGTGCSSGLFGSRSADEQEVAELKRRMVELQQQATVSEVELARLRQKVQRLERELDEKASAPAPARPAGVVETLPPPVFSRQPTIEATDLETSERDEAPPPSRPAPPPPPTAPRAAPGREAQALYDEGYTLFHQKDYDAAEERFGRFLQRYPNTDLTDNAQFWIGECRYARGELQGALEAFTATVERFPDGNKIPDALLKAGRCLQALGERDEARQTFEEIQRRFPGTVAAAAAAEHLAEL